MKQKVIVITAQIYSTKTAENYFKSSFENDGFDFEFWSIAECNVYKNPINVEVNQHEINNIYSFKDIKIVSKKLEQFKDESVYFFIYFLSGLLFNIIMNFFPLFELTNFFFSTIRTQLFNFKF